MRDGYGLTSPVNAVQPDTDGHKELKMNKLGGGTVVLAGLFLVILGLLMTSDIIDFLGWLIVIAGVVVAVIGLIRVFSGGKSGASDY